MVRVGEPPFFWSARARTSIVEVSVIVTCLVATAFDFLNCSAAPAEYIWSYTTAVPRGWVKLSPLRRPSEPWLPEPRLRLGPAPPAQPRSSPVDRASVFLPCGSPPLCYVM